MTELWVKVSLIIVFRLKEEIKREALTWNILGALSPALKLFQLWWIKALSGSIWKEHNAKISRLKSINENNINWSRKSNG